MLETPPAPGEGLIPSGGSFDGLVEAAGAARIDGRVEGEVIVAESLWVGADAVIRARVEARDVVVEGLVEGEIHAPAKIELRPTARVRAVLHTGCFVLAEGAYFEGRCHTIPNALEEPPEPGEG